MLHRLLVLAAASVLILGCAGEKEETSSPSLYQRLGGETGIRKVVDELVARASVNPKVNFTRQGHPRTWPATPENVAVFKQRMVEFIAQNTGGPQRYTGRDMRNAHVGMGISDAEFNALADDLKLSMNKLNVPAREQRELLAVVETTRPQIVER